MLERSLTRRRSRCTGILSQKIISAVDRKSIISSRKVNDVKIRIEAFVRRHFLANTPSPRKRPRKTRHLANDTTKIIVFNSEDIFSTFVFLKDLISDQVKYASKRERQNAREVDRRHAAGNYRKLATSRSTFPRLL